MSGNRSSEFSRSFKRGLVTLLSAFVRRPVNINKIEKLPSTIVILAQERLGDSILLTSLLRNLKDQLPNSEINLIVFSKDSYTFFKEDEAVDNLYYVKANYLKYFVTIRIRKFDLLFNTKDHPSFSFILHSVLIKADVKIGIKHQYHKKFYNHLIDIDFYEHIVEKNCSLLKFLGIEISKEECRPSLPNSSVKKEIIDFTREIDSDRVIGINLSAGETSREWSLKKWIEFISKIKMELIVFCMPNRVVDKLYLENNFDNIIKSPNTSSIYDAAYLIKNIRVLVSPDTSLIHVASCYNIPVVGLYRSDPTHFSRFKPYLIPYIRIISPTGKNEDIQTNEVIEAVNTLL